MTDNYLKSMARRRRSTSRRTGLPPPGPLRVSEYTVLGAINTFVNTFGRLPFASLDGIMTSDPKKRVFEAKEAYELFPELILRFYERHIVWRAIDPSFTVDQLFWFEVTPTQGSRGSTSLRRRRDTISEENVRSVLLASNINGQLRFAIEMKDSSILIINANEAYDLCPQMIFQFYEKHVVWGERQEFFSGFTQPITVQLLRSGVTSNQISSNSRSRVWPESQNKNKIIEKS